MDENVIRPSFKDGRPPISVKACQWHGCKHKKVEVDEILRTVACRDCKAMLDPFNVLLQIANGFRSMDYRIGEMRRVEERDKRRKEKEKARYLAKEQSRKIKNGFG